MDDNGIKGEIRDSIVRDLLEKARKRNYSQYLESIRLTRIRFFRDAKLTFAFPVTALIGPNGGGKSTILGAAALAYKSIKPETFFQQSRVGDASMDDWQIDYEVIDKSLNKTGLVLSTTTFSKHAWHHTDDLQRRVVFFSINRTVPIAENSSFSHKRLLRYNRQGSNGAKLTISTETISDIEHIKSEAEKILGKSLRHFKLLRISIEKQKIKSKRIKRSKRRKDAAADDIAIHTVQVQKLGKIVASEKLMFVGGDGQNDYSEYNFGAGEASVIRLVADSENLPDNSLILIEEIENGLHPVAVRRLVEYFIDVARRKRLQVVFTTHSDYALDPLPSEAIWASFDGRLQQGKLSIEVLRAVSGRVDTRLAIFVEDEYAKYWIEAIIREKLGEHLDEIGVFPVGGDGNALRVHLGHMIDPSVSFHSVCMLDGDSSQQADPKKRVYKLPGGNPESTVFNAVISNLQNNIAFLTVACQRSVEKQDFVAAKIREISHTNRDPHLLFDQVGIKIGFVPASVVRGAFFSVWIQENVSEADEIARHIKSALSLPAK